MQHRKQSAIVRKPVMAIKGRQATSPVTSGIAYARGDDRQRLLNLRFGDKLTQTDMNATPKSDVSLFTSCFRVENLRILETPLHPGRPGNDVSA